MYIVAYLLLSAIVYVYDSPAHLHMPQLFFSLPIACSPSSVLCQSSYDLL